MLFGNTSLISFVKLITASIVIFAGGNADTKLNLEHSKVDSIKLSSRDYRIEVISKYIDDSTDSSESLALCPLVFEQRIKLYYKNKLMSNRLFDIASLSVLSASKQRIKVLKTRIVEVGIVQGRTHSFFVINGYGGCSTCSEYISILNKNGEDLFINYREGNKIILQKGNMKNVLSLNGIDAKKFRTGNFQKKKVEPKSTICY